LLCSHNYFFLYVEFGLRLPALADENSWKVEMRHQGFVWLVYMGRLLIFRG
jgi:hypothetical protein